MCLPFAEPKVRLWYSLFRDAGGAERVAAGAVPASYYKSYFEASDALQGGLHKLRGKPGYRPMIANKRK